MQILIVDDDDFALHVLDRTLDRMGHKAISARDGKEALEILRRGEIRLVVTDWDMPGMGGIELCHAIREADFNGYVYVIMLTGREGAQQRREGLYAGADDFLVKPLDPEELLICLRTAERILALETRDITLFAMAKLAESRDPETGTHIERVQNYTRLLAKQLSSTDKYRSVINDEYIRLIYQTSPLHDLGKVGIPDAVLLKPSKLTVEEFSIMKTHTRLGAQTLEAALARFPNVLFLEMARDIALSHHEHYDGSGYPDGLAGENIPLCARIVAVADVYDALTSRRIYKAAISHNEARAIIVQERRRHFDPDVVDAFLKTEKQFIETGDRLRDLNTTALSKVSETLKFAVQPLKEAEPCCIMVVDDEPKDLEELNVILKPTGQKIVLARDGLEALELAQQHNPGVVIADWVMPKVDGVELCIALRARVGTRPLHFIMLTAHSDKKRLVAAFEAGVDDFVAKPFVPEELLARVRAGIRSVRLQTEHIRDSLKSQELNLRLGDSNSRLEMLSLTDDLTGLFNRRHAMLRMAEEWSAAEKYGKALSVAMADLDHFKKINDQWGHDAGDVVLKCVATLLKQTCRAQDIICRIGGEEFFIIMPNHVLEEAQICAERCRKAIADHVFTTDRAQIRVTLSIGIANRTSEMSQFLDLFKAADDSLYNAKRLGRNRVQFPEESGIDRNDASSTGSDQTSSSPVDIKSMIRRCGGDRVFADSVLKKFAKDVPVELEKMSHAQTTGDPQQLRRSAHNMKGLAAFIGAEHLADIARGLEEATHSNIQAETQQLISKIQNEVDEVLKAIMPYDLTGRNQTIIQ